MTAIFFLKNESEFIRQYQALLANNMQLEFATKNLSSLESLKKVIQNVVTALECNPDNNLANISLSLKDLLDKISFINEDLSKHEALPDYFHKVLQVIFNPTFTRAEFDEKFWKFRDALISQLVLDRDLENYFREIHSKLKGELTHLHYKAAEAAIQAQTQQASEMDCLAHYQRIFFHKSANYNNAVKWALAISLFVIGTGLCITGILSAIGLPLIIAGSVIATSGIIYSGHLAYNKISGKSSLIDPKQEVTSANKINQGINTFSRKEERPLAPVNAMSSSLYSTTSTIDNSSDNQHDANDFLYNPPMTRL